MAEKSRDQVERLSVAMRDAVQFLENCNERQWAFILHGLVDRLTDEDGGAVTGILALFGGMGSFNDLYICPQNGHRVDDASVIAVNQRLRNLSGTIWSAARELQREIDRPG